MMIIINLLFQTLLYSCIQLSNSLFKELNVVLHFEQYTRNKIKRDVRDVNMGKIWITVSEVIKHGETHYMSLNLNII